MLSPSELADIKRIHDIVKTIHAGDRLTPAQQQAYDIYLSHLNGHSFHDMDWMSAWYNCVMGGLPTATSPVPLHETAPEFTDHMHESLGVVWEWLQHFI